MIRFLLILLGAMLLPASAMAKDYQLFIDKSVRVCEGSEAPDFTSDICKTARLYEVDPQGRELWVEHIFEADPALLSGGKPLGLFVSGKASSEVFLNGVNLGANGTPGPSALSEQPGDMDAVFFVPEGTLRSGENRLVMRMSAMHGAITLDSPIHNVVLAPYRDPRRPGLGTWFAIVTFGLFLAAFVYFGVSAMRGRDREGSALIALASLAVALQLAAESMRDLLPYPYPLHDLRLMLILGFAMLTGLSLFSYILQLLFKEQRKGMVLAVAALLIGMIVTAFFVPGFDRKTQAVLIAATNFALSAGLCAAMLGDRRGWWIVAGGAMITGAIWWLGGQFLDFYLYYFMAGLLLWQFFRQARGDNTEEPASTEPETLHRIELTSSGKVEFVDVPNIVRLSGAGDYVEVFLKNGRSSLYTGSLAALERELTTGFIRVHRSHIVNASMVTSLEREAAGIGQLHMSDGSTVPVSRRNMAQVREALTRN